MMPLIPIHKHRKYSRLFLFNNGSPFPQSSSFSEVQNPQKVVSDMLTHKSDKSKPVTRVQYLQVFFVLTQNLHTVKCTNSKCTI